MAATPSQGFTVFPLSVQQTVQQVFQKKTHFSFITSLYKTVIQRIIKALRREETEETGDKNQRSGRWRISRSEVSYCEKGDEASGANVGFICYV